MVDEAIKLEGWENQGLTIEDFIAFEYFVDESTCTSCDEIFQGFKSLNMTEKEALSKVPIENELCKPFVEEYKRSNWLTLALPFAILALTSVVKFILSSLGDFIRPEDKAS